MCSSLKKTDEYTVILNNIFKGVYVMSKVIDSIKLKDGRVLKYIEGMSDIDTIIGSIDYDIERFKRELKSPNCNFDRKVELKGYISDFEMARDGWEELKDRR